MIKNRAKLRSSRNESNLELAFTKKNPPIERLLVRLFKKKKHAPIITKQIFSFFIKKKGIKSTIAKKKTLSTRVPPSSGGDDFSSSYWLPDGNDVIGNQLAMPNGDRAQGGRVRAGRQRRPY